MVIAPSIWSWRDNRVEQHSSWPAMDKKHEPEINLVVLSHRYSGVIYTGSITSLILAVLCCRPNTPSCLYHRPPNYSVPGAPVMPTLLELSYKKICQSWRTPCLPDPGFALWLLISFSQRRTLWTKCHHPTLQKRTQRLMMIKVPCNEGHN